MTINKEIPTIYASIGNREDVTANPKTVDAVRSVLTSDVARVYRVTPFVPEVAHDYIRSLELALREALGDEFLAKRIREVADDPEMMSGRGEIWGDILRLVANKLSPPQSM